MFFFPSAFYWRFSAHAAIVAINETIDKNDPDELFKVLSNPAARLLNLYESNKVGYQNKLAEEKHRKTAAADAKAILAFNSYKASLSFFVNVQRLMDQ